MTLASLSLAAALLLLPANTVAVTIPENGYIHIPIRRNNNPNPLQKRGTETGTIGLGNFFDVTYQVMLRIGSVETPLILDTGSSDLWVISDQCTGNCTASGTPEYPQASFQPESGLDIDLRYGDSRTGTSAQGLIGRDTVAVAGLERNRQLFAAINRTTTAMDQVRAAGIFGLGFPINSVLVLETFAHDFPQAAGGSSSAKRDLPHPNVRGPRISVAERLPGLGTHAPASGETVKRQQQQGSRVVDDLINSYLANGPIISRLVLEGALARPLVSITLSRNTIDIGGNEGLLSIGALPPGITDADLTWAPVRLYTYDDGGIPSPPSNPGEIYPIAWEVPLDGVYLNGQLLPDSELPPTVSVSALVDTGNSLMRGPEDVVNAILRNVATAVDGTFPCANPPTLEFGIGGKRFPIDPRDLVSQVYERDTDACTLNLVATDRPGSGFLYSWSIGDPLLRSALVVYDYGNITHPSITPPRIGFLSTVPPNAKELLQAAIQNAGSGNFPATQNPAPTGVPVPATGAGGTTATGVGGLPQATTPSGGSGGSGRSGAESSLRMNVGVSVGAALLAVAAAFLGL